MAYVFLVVTLYKQDSLKAASADAETDGDVLETAKISFFLHPIQASVLFLNCLDVKIGAPNICLAELCSTSSSDGFDKGSNRFLFMIVYVSFVFVLFL